VPLGKTNQTKEFKISILFWKKLVNIILKKGKQVGKIMRKIRAVPSNRKNNSWIVK
jgi:hypothetical protein